MNILVTGGAGYIGSATAEALIQAGHQVTVYDALLTGHRQAVPRGAYFVQADLSDQVTLTKTLVETSCQAVLHFAASIEPGESMKNPGKFFLNNVNNSLQLIEAAVRAGVLRFVLSSTAAVYASNDEPLCEESPLGPCNVYGQTKLMIEQALDWYRQIHGLHYAALRYFNAAGARTGHGEAHQPETHLIPLVLQVALGQRPAAFIYGTDYPTPDGTCIRDYIHINDLVAAHLLALDALDDHDHLVYNLGNGSSSGDIDSISNSAGFSVRQVIETARQVTGQPIPVVEVARRPGDAARLVACSDRIRQDLGWQPRTPELKDIIASAWEWHHQNPKGYG